MNLYSELIFPRLLDTVMSKSPFSQYRKTLLAQVSGEVLDIGFGTGLNLPYYPPEIKKLTAIDVNPGMNAIARKRLRNSSFNIDLQQLNGEHLPMGDRTFDTAVSTWTLCSIANVEQALQEIYRVTGGQILIYRTWTQYRTQSASLATSTDPSTKNNCRRLSPQPQY